MRTLFQTISATGLVIAVVGFFCWVALLSSGAGGNFATWSITIDILWKVIPGALLVSVVSGIASATIRGQSGKRSPAGVILAVVAVLVMAGIYLLLISLRIG